MTHAAGLKIGALAQRTGSTAPTIRYYESIGLLPQADRQGGQRRYAGEDVRRLRFIRRCRDFGFSLEQVRVLSGVIENRERRCSEAREIAQTHLDAVRSRIAELHGLEESLAEFVESCDASCVGGPGPQCVPLARLSDPTAPVAPGDRRLQPLVPS